MIAALDDALARLGIDGGGWSVRVPAHNQWLTAAIWELARGDDRMIVKRLSPVRDLGTTPFEQHWSAHAASTSHWSYWAREALAYQSGLTDSFAGAGLRAPRCLGVDIRRDDAVLALEYVDGVPAESWNVANYADAARALGLGQARCLLDAPLPDADWLSRRFIRHYSSDKPVRYDLLESDEAWRQPLVADFFPAELRDAAVALHRQRNRLYDVIESLPQTLCHLDFWTKNLIRANDGTIALLDWAFVGFGAVGEDVGNLVPDAVFDHFVEPERMAELRSIVFEGYVAGLEAGGWQGDPDLVAMAMAASAVKYDWLTPLMLERAAAAQHKRYGGRETIESSELYRRRGLALLDNASQALRALDVAGRG